MTDDGTILRELLRTKRDGGPLSAEECEWFLERVASDSIDDASQAALLASIWFRGMEPDELAAWTRSMVDTGATLDLSGFDAPCVDKHSTGGVGDKVSLPLAPALAAMDCVVPMISGRGLGHTGGTLDKLEAVPGVRTGLSEDEIQRVLREAGCVICAQTREIAPADRRLYALRDRVELVESIPLIASSIVSKKAAEGIDALVLDVKAGSGAFLVDPDRGRVLARTMVDLAGALGVRTSARITWMGRPLGRAVGHALEIEETRATLRGEGPADLVEITCAFGADLVALARGGERDPSAVADVLASGEGLERFERMLRAQGGNGEALPAAPDVAELRAPASGTLAFDDVREVGLAVRALGGGRAAAADTIDPAVGLVWRRVAGEHVDAGDVLAEVHHRGGRGLEEALARLERSLHRDESHSSESPPREPPLLLELIPPVGPTRS